MCCGTLQYVKVCCGLLQCVALCSSVLQCLALCKSVENTWLRHSLLVFGSVLQRSAVYFGVLQHVAVRCSALASGHSLQRRTPQLPKHPSNGSMEYVPLCLFITNVGLIMSKCVAVCLPKHLGLSFTSFKSERDRTRARSEKER